MRSVGVKQLKAHLSEYLRLVKSGQTVVVTDRNEVVAELRPARPQSGSSASLEEILDGLRKRGDITRSAIRKGHWTWKVKGLGLAPRTAVEILDEIRSDR
jgi:prevent-host-death family protein